MKTPIRVAAIALLSLSLGAVAAEPGAGGDEAEVQSMVRSLKPAPKTRSLSFVEPEGGGSSATQPRVALTVQFGLNSAKLTPSSTAALKVLAAALRTSELESYRFEIAGHTDSSGSRLHNIGLSQLRAEAVRDALVKDFGVDAARVAAKGYGPDQGLADLPASDGRNRRVEVVNVGAMTTP
ncbi:MAG TPA: OmpA family protein [Solimonas sp.]|nr:OmpA family protein [Solimonas sp.]